MKVMKSAVLAAALFISFTAAGSAQTSGDLELQLKPEQIKDGLPQEFTFLLINKSSHDIRLPIPIVDCSSSYAGFILLRLHFIPLKSGDGIAEHGCTADHPGVSTVLMRIKEWRVLRPGESLRMEAKRVQSGESLSGGQGKSIEVDDHAAGSYEFWASYTPPTISSEDQDTLTAVGIDFLRAALSSSHTIFRKDP